ncbi:hypothetical protein J4E91_009665 [Alternaria rosae]|nr:hypothetical protein J4E91_009665 [Alternaria rosae]
MASNNGTPVPSKLTIGRSNRLSQTPNLTPNNTTSTYSRQANQNQTTNAPKCIECGMKCPNCSWPSEPAVKQQAKSGEPEQRESEGATVQLEATTEIENKDQGKVAEENKDTQTENEEDKDDNNLHMRGEDKDGEDEDEDEDDAKVEWSKYVSKRLYKMARTDPSSMTVAELEQFNEQGLKYQYDKHFTTRERTLWDDESLPRHLILKLIRFRQRIERDAADALETEDKEPNYDAQIFDQLSNYLSDLKDYAYELVAEDHEREVKEMEKMQEAVERESVEEEYESAEEEYEHPGEDDYRPPYFDRSRYLPAMEHDYPTSMQHPPYPPVNYDGRNTYGQFDFFGQNPAPQDNWSGDASQSGRGKTTYSDWNGPPSPKEETTQW